MMLLGLGVTLIVTGVLSQGQRDPVSMDYFSRLSIVEKCDLILRGMVTVASDKKIQSLYNTDELVIFRPDQSTAILRGNVTILKKLKQIFMVRIVVKKVTMMGKSEMILSYDMCDFCAELNDPESQFKTELDTFLFPRGECPFKGGTYGVLNLTLEADKFPINAWNEGVYEAELCTYEARDTNCNVIDLQGCVTLPFNIECS